MSSSTLVWIGILVFVSVLFITQGLASMRRQRSSLLARRLGIVDREALLEALAEEGTGFQARLSRVGKRFAPKEALEETAKLLRWAGVNMRADQFYGIRITLAVMLAGFMLALSVVGMGMRGILITAVTAMIGYLLPDAWLKSKVAERHRQVERQLLSFLDMVSVAVRSGLGLQDAIRKVSEKIGGVLGTEFGLAASTQQMGATLIESLNQVADNLGHDELNTVIANISEGLRMGTPVAQMLRDQAEMLRRERQLKADELAQKTSFKMLAPIFLCDFIPLLIIVLGPAVVQLMKSFGM